MVKSDNNDTRVILSGWRSTMDADNTVRAGRYILQPQGYRAFIPANLPPVPPISMDDEMWTLLSQADRALGRLDGSTAVLPHPDLFVYMYVRKEAVLSSQIEGTQASLIDLVEFESKAAESGIQGDVEEVVNYVAAMNYGLNLSCPARSRAHRHRSSTWSNLSPKPPNPVSREMSRRL